MPPKPADKKPAAAAGGAGGAAVAAAVESEAAAAAAAAESEAAAVAARKLRAERALARPAPALAVDALSEAERREAELTFHKFDLDRSGTMDRSELRTALEELGLRLSPALFDRYIEQSVLLADVDADGLLTAAEFVVTFATVFAPSRKFGNALRKAAGRGERDVVLDLLARGCDPNVGDGRGWTAVHCAAEFGKTEIIELIQDSWGPDRVDIDAEEKTGWTPLMMAASNGHVDTVRFLLDAGARLDAVSVQGRTPLHAACAGNALPVVRLLVAHGASVHATDKAGWTPLFVAAVRGATDIVAFLLHEAHADVLHRDAYGWTASHVARPEVVGTGLLPPPGPSALEFSAHSGAAHA